MRYMAIWLSGILVSTSTVLAQTYQQNPPPSPGEKGVMIEWLIATGFLVACLVVSFKPAKRSNLK